MGVAFGRGREVDKVMHQIGDSEGVILGSMRVCGFFRRGAGAVILKNVPMKKHSEAFYEYLAEFKALSDEEIVGLFNEQVGVQGWVSRRASYLAAIHYEFGRRRFDYSALASKEGKYPALSYRYKVRLDGKKIIKLPPPPKKKTCCERAEAFYLGITCPHCHKPFRKNITSV